MRENILTKSNHILQCLTGGSKIILPNLAIILFFIASTTIVNIAINSTNSAFALDYQSTTTLDFTINPTISLTVSGDLTIDSLMPGDYNDSNIITVTAESNSISGYNLSATASSNNLVNTANSNYVFNNLSTTAGTASTLSSITPGYWGYSYSVDNGTNWISGSSGNIATGYAGLPVDNDDNGATGATGVRLLSTNTHTGSSSIQFKIGASATSTQVSGNYTGTVNFYAVANPNPPTLADITYMQDVTSDMVANTAEEMTFTLKDKRDEQEYTVAKLKDGKLWMLENLAIDLTTVTLDKLKGTAEKPNTNALEQTLTYLKNGGGSGQYPASGVSTAWISSSQNVYTLPYIAVSGACNDAYCVNNPSSGNWTSGATTQATINGTTSIAQGKIGVYYNYCAASAGSYCYASGSGTGNASEDICPAGWRLPTGSSSGEFQALYTAYSSNVSSFQTTLATPLSGYFASGTAYNQGHYGYFWSSTIDYGSSMYFLYVNSSDVDPSNTNIRNRGYSVRCLLSS